MSKRSPADFLKQALGRNVTVKLNNGLEYQGDIISFMALLLGILACLDGFMNIVLEQTEEYENGELKTKYNEAFFRGNNGKISIFSS